MTKELTLRVTDLEKKAIAFCREKDVPFPIANYLVDFATEVTKELEKGNKELKAQIENYKLSEIEAKEIMAELEAQIEKMKKYIKACWVEENLNDYSSYITNSSDEFRDLVKELNEEIRNGR